MKDLFSKQEEEKKMPIIEENPSKISKALNKLVI